jgi:PAS domain S-box-containing protein
MRTSRRWSQFGLALLSVAVAAGLRALFGPMLGTTVPFLTFFPAVTVSAWFGRLAGGLMATALAAPVALYLFGGQPFSFHASGAELFAVTVFAAEAILITWVIEQMHRSRQRADRHTHVVEASVAQRDAAEARARTAHERLVRAIESLPMLTSYVDEDQRYRFINKAYEDWCGRPRGEILGRRLSEVLGDEAYDVVRPRVERALAGEHLTWEAELPSRDAGTRHVSASFVPDRSPDGHIRGYFAVIIDITERKRQEAGTALATAISDVVARSLDYRATVQELARAILPGAGDFCIILSVGEQGDARAAGIGHRDAAKVISVHRLATLLEQEVDIIQGSLVERAIRTREPQLVRQFSIENARAATTDAAILDALRTLDPRSLIIAPLVARGRSLGVVALGRTGGREAYTGGDLAAAGELAGRLAAAMDNARLFTEAMEANRLKDEFLATLSHELRTPLNAILGYSMMLRTGMLPADGRARALEIIERNARHQTKLVEDILDVSRIVTGGVRLNVRPVALAPVIEEAVESVRPAADAKGVRLQVELDPAAGPVSGDADRLRQVVWNLLSNAVKFTPRGGRVQIRLERVDSHVKIVVSDTGRGIPPGFVPEIFEPFRQIESAASREHGGLGLGLAIARHLTELHGGSIHAASPGLAQGSTFTVWLPLMIARPGATPPEGREQPTAEAAGGAGGLPDLRGVSVLLVEDDVDAVDLARTVLEIAGARVRAAGSAAEGLVMLDEELPEVLIFDIGLPGMDGYDLIRAVRERPPELGGRLPAAALTAFARSEDRARALRSGFQMHVAKPINPTELALVVQSLATRAHAS